MIRNTASKLFRALCGMAVMLAFMAGITSVSALAASNGVYIATATPHYQHPVTGIVEDAGSDGSSVLGQSMTESATYKNALVEVDAAGNVYITVRLQLMDNIQNPQFQVDGASVSASLMQEDYTNNTADYRMKVNSENSIIRCKMYIIAMGRDVVFYITVSNLQSGSGDFIVSIKEEQSKQPEPAQSQSSVQAQPSTQAQPSAQTQPSTQAQPSAQNQPTVQTQKSTNMQALEATQNPMDIQLAEATQTPVENQPSSQTISPVQGNAADTEHPVTESSVTDQTEQSNVETSHPDFAETETPENDKDAALGLQEFDKDGNKVDQNSKDEKKNAKKSNSAALLWAISGVIVVIAAAGGLVWRFYFFKKKN